MRILSFVLALFATPVSAHEFWLEPLAYQVAADGRLEANIVNGQEFSGTQLPYLPQRFRHFIAFNDGQSQVVPGRAGDTPGLNMDVVGEGLNIVVYQALPAIVDYENWEKFENFLTHKDLGDRLARHTERGLPLEGFKEVYSRYSKTLIGVGDAAGNDLRTGLETEIVALTNPYTDDVSGGMRVQLFYGQDVRANEQIELFEKAPDYSVSITLHRTDADGIATLPVKPGYSYMADAVVIREPQGQIAADTNAAWETLWANLTFAVPQ